MLGLRETHFGCLSRFHWPVLEKILVLLDTLTKRPELTTAAPNLLPPMENFRGLHVWPMATLKAKQCHPDYVAAYVAFLMPRLFPNLQTWDFHVFQHKPEPSRQQRLADLVHLHIFGERTAEGATWEMKGSGPLSPMMNDYAARTFTRTIRHLHPMQYVSTLTLNTVTTYMYLLINRQPTRNWLQDVIFLKS